MLPLLIYFGITIWCYSWIPDPQDRKFFRLQEIIRIPGVYYLYFVLGFIVLYVFLQIEKACGKEKLTKPPSPVKQALWLSSSIFVYSIMIGLSIAAEYLDIKLGLTNLMIMFVGIFMLGVTVTSMFLKQAIPLRINSKLVDEMHLSDRPEEGKGCDNESFERN